MDLNRNWDKPADPELAPENTAFERWIAEMIKAGRKPDLAFDLHNDQSGRIHISRPDIALDQYLSEMERYEALLRQYTWFTEGHTGGGFQPRLLWRRDAGTLWNHRLCAGAECQLD